VADPEVGDRLGKGRAGLETGVESWQWVVSACHSSLGRAASKRMKEERGRLCGWGVIRPWRERMRQMVATEGTVSTVMPRWWAMV
jgi:hypothetical protein